MRRAPLHRRARARGLRRRRATADADCRAATGRSTELANVLQLRSDFEADAGKTRVILLFSPT